MMRIFFFLPRPLRSYLLLSLSIFCGIGAGLLGNSFLLKGAEVFSTLFMNFLKLLAAPIVFLSILSTLLEIKSFSILKNLGKKVFSYTLLTTIAATLVALTLFLALKPTTATLSSLSQPEIHVEKATYLSFFMKIIPSNFFEAFLESNVIAIAFMALVLGIAALKLPEENKQPLRHFFSSLFKLILKTNEILIFFMPLAVWAFTTILIQELKRNHTEFYGLSLYLTVILGANLIQGFFVLPLFLKLKGISPLKVVRESIRALVMAFFSKSSNATLPLTLECAEKGLKIDPRISNFSLPLCTVINMNGCAAFILTTVLFVAGINGHVFNFLDYGFWVILATLAAIGNAGVPMGCFFLSMTFLIGMGVPLKTMGLILPFYAFLDMVETSLNVWSDLCVTAVVDKECKEEAVTLHSLEVL